MHVCKLHVNHFFLEIKWMKDSQLEIYIQDHRPVCYIKAPHCWPFVMGISLYSVMQTVFHVMTTPSMPVEILTWQILDPEWYKMWTLKNVLFFFQKKIFSTKRVIRLWYFGYRLHPMIIPFWSINHGEFQLQCLRRKSIWKELQNP